MSAVPFIRSVTFPPVFTVSSERCDRHELRCCRCPNQRWSRCTVPWTRATLTPVRFV